eukprot:10214377-Lingulodinium_polyedra.AAC.1
MLLLRRSKRGAPDSEKVLLANPALIRILRMHVAARGPQERLVKVSYPRFNAALQQALEALGFRGVRFASHSLRRGGAASLAMRGWAMPAIMAAG